MSFVPQCSCYVSERVAPFLFSNPGCCNQSSPTVDSHTRIHILLAKAWFVACTAPNVARRLERSIDGSHDPDRWSCHLNRDSSSCQGHMAIELSGDRPGQLIEGVDDGRFPRHRTRVLSMLRASAGDLTSFDTYHQQSSALPLWVSHLANP